MNRIVLANGRSPLRDRNVLGGGEQHRRKVKPAFGPDFSTIGKGIPVWGSVGKNENRIPNDNDNDNDIGNIDSNGPREATRKRRRDDNECQPQPLPCHSTGIEKNQRKRPSEGSHARENPRQSKRAKSSPSEKYSCTYPNCGFSYVGDISVLAKHVASNHGKGPGLDVHKKKKGLPCTHTSSSSSSSTSSFFFKPLAAFFSKSTSTPSKKSQRPSSPVDRLKAENALSPLTDIRAVKPRAYLVRAHRSRTKTSKTECEGNRFITNADL